MFRTARSKGRRNLAQLRFSNSPIARSVGERMKLAYIIFAASIALPDDALASGCHIKTEMAIYCPSGRDAVVAFETYGGDVALMKQSNNLYIIHSAGCGLVPKSARVLMISHGRVPFVNGWVGVTTVQLNEKYDGAMADAYLDGKCDLYNAKKNSFTLHQDYALPQFSK